MAVNMALTVKANDSMYRKYAEQLVNEGHAYYAFDTPEELEKMELSLPKRMKIHLLNMMVP